MKELESKLEEVAQSEGTLKEKCSALNAEMAEMLRNYDEDKRTAISKWVLVTRGLFNALSPSLRYMSLTLHMFVTERRYLYFPQYTSVHASHGIHPDRVFIESFNATFCLKVSASVF